MINHNLHVADKTTGQELVYPVSDIKRERSTNTKVL